LFGWALLSSPQRGCRSRPLVGRHCAPGRGRSAPNAGFSGRTCGRIGQNARGRRRRLGFRQMGSNSVSLEIARDDWRAGRAADVPPIGKAPPSQVAVGARRAALPIEGDTCFTGGATTPRVSMYPTRLMFQALATAALTLGVPDAAGAQCFCEFINGVMQPMCGSSLDIRPRCGHPIREWSTPVLVPPPPPLRVDSCKPAVICYRHGVCRTKWVCD
jgi:hypothetical protein